MIIIVLPAYNEAGAIGSLLESFIEAFRDERWDWRVILVNDGSTDDTEKAARGFQGRLKLEIVNHPSNRGLAESLKTGLLRAVGSAEGKDIIITMDSDGSHLPGLIFRMARLIKEGNDLIIASRYERGSRVVGVTLYRRTLSRLAAILCRVIFPMPGVRDYTCGYRAYRASLLKRAWAEYGEEIISEPGFSCMVDLLLKVRKYLPIITEVPLILRYDLKAGPSKMNVGKTVKQTLWLLLRRRLGIARRGAKSMEQTKSCKL